ncbi:MAG: hypothetical protein WB677_27810, partial [Xanthobacteraceae bacterium]
MRSGDGAAQDDGRAAGIPGHKATLNFELTGVEWSRSMSMWRQVISPNEGGGMLFDVGILDDGTLHNPKGYPDDQVRAAVLAAEARRRERQHERRSAGAKKAAITRARRKEKRIA